MSPRTLDELFDLSGRTALVTGGATGLGRQMSDALAEAGANLVLSARNLERCEEAAQELRDRGTSTMAVACDVSDEHQVAALVDSVVERFGGIDILVNNAGTTWGAPAEEQPIDRWRRVLDVNLTGAFLCAQAAGRLMLETGGGKIINIVSGAAFQGSPPEIRRASAYSSSKGGLLALTHDLACQWGHRNINVNAIAPGWFRSSMADVVLGRVGTRIVEGIPLGRIGDEDDLKGVVVFLASPASDYVTGQMIVVDGGKSVW